MLLLLNLPFYLNFFDAENKISLVKLGKFWLTLSMRNCCTDWKNLADFLYYRKQAGLTQEKLAEAIDMSTSYIGDMEARERFPSAETIDKIAAALEIPVSLLFNERGSPDSLKDTFLKIYGASLKDELSSRILKDINEVCDLL